MFAGHCTILLLLANKVLLLNFLAILPHHGKSHFVVFSVYLEELANKGHNVTVISHFPQKNPPKNYKDISLAGSEVVPNQRLPPEKKGAILDAMKEFPQRFIWKWNSEDLGHPKTLAFISHAGMGSTTEAILFGVPIIAMPFFGDQPSNAAAIEESGLGVRLHYKDLCKDNLVAALKKVLDPVFRKRVQEVSSAWHDRPMSPLDTAVFWTEFAAKHPNFTFRTAAADVPMYQSLYLDVIAAILVVIISSLWRDPVVEINPLVSVNVEKRILFQMIPLNALRCSI